MLLTLGELAGCIGARLIAAPKQWVETAPCVISIDTRTLNRGDTFIALRGPSFDGNTFLQQAIERGAAALIVDYTPNGFLLTDISVPVFQVDNSYNALTGLGQEFRKRSGAMVIGVTGSCGKTTTKEFCQQLFSGVYRTLATPKNENNFIGVSKLLCRLDERTEVVVVEMGTFAPGDIDRLREIALPDQAIITMIGEAHLARFPSRESLAREKFSIVPGCSQAILNAADPLSVQLAKMTSLIDQAVWIAINDERSLNERNTLRGSLDGDYLTIRWAENSVRVKRRFSAEAHIRDALFAVASAHLAGVKLSDLASAYSELRLPRWRSETYITPAGARVVFDAYNSSPSAARVAFSLLASARAARRIVVLGSMEDLGDNAAEMQRQIGAEAAQVADILFIGGGSADQFECGALSIGSGEVTRFESVEELAVQLRALLTMNDVVVVKASRSDHMENLLSLINAKLAEGSQLAIVPSS